MVQFAKLPNGHRNDYGRINLLIEDKLGQYQNIIQKWIAKFIFNPKKSLCFTWLYYSIWTSQDNRRATKA
ncbi:TPA: hypothetical protein I8038_000267 [Legionella pneumophila]|nr:hypothetical protein [Legionella pneumophila]